jgi:F-type H+-transporting ATPase subunit delta
MEPVASRYALALTKIANESTKMQAYLDACQQLLQLIQTDPTLLHFLTNEFYERSTKFKLLDELFIESNWLQLGSFLKVLIQNRRTRYLEKILIETIGSLRVQLEKQVGFIYSVSALTKDQITQLTEVLSSHLGHPITLTNQLDERLIGGFRIDIQGKIFDASLLHQLSTLKQRLLKRG